MSKRKTSMFSAARLRSVRPQPWMVHAAGAAVVIGAALAFYGWFLAPTAEDVEVRKKRLDQLQLLLSSGERIGAEHQRLTARLAALDQASTQTRQRIPRRPSTQEFIEKITEIAETMGLAVELCTAAALQEKPTHSQTEVTCRVSGSYASVCRFLAAVDQLPQISRISTLEIDSATNSRAYPIHVVFQLYYRSELHDTEMKRGTL
jgi:Tfp pilus assembly protein PilO